MREAFEQAILDNPDEVANYAAYADWLTEQGDPRGEFIQVQLALEDETVTGKKRQQFNRREQALLEKHESEWLGELEPFLGSSIAHGDILPEYAWRRGFLDALRVPCFNMAFAQAVAA